MMDRKALLATATLCLIAGALVIVGPWSIRGAPQPVSASTQRQLQSDRSVGPAMAGDLGTSGSATSAEPTDGPIERRLELNLFAQLEAAVTIREVLALLAAPHPPANAADRLHETRQYLRDDLAKAEQKLQHHRMEADPGNEDWRLRDKKLRAGILTIESDLAVLRRGDYCFTHYTIRRTPFLHLPRFELRRWHWGHDAQSLLRVLCRDEWSLLHQLRREIDHEEKVLTFNGMTEGTRRSVLQLREESLRDDPPEEQGWLTQYFPEQYGIDKQKAKIY